MPATSAPAGLQSALQPHGPEAQAIAELTGVLVVGGTLIFVLVMALAALALRGPRPWLARRGMIWGGGVVFPVVALSALLVYVLLLSPRPAAAGAADVTIEVAGHQWWWEVNYLDANGRPDFTTANEIRLPVGRTVEVRLRSDNVLHSFWVPALAGKLDLIPGKDNRLRLAASRPGRYRGQCAEYCGGPHGQMAFFVVSEPPERFEAWREAQRREAAVRGTRGEQLFLSHCGVCHTVRGTEAAGRLGPDLTHVASRVSLGAGILPNDPATLARWIADSQHIKPGNLMPEFKTFDEAALRELATYLAALE